MLNGPVLVVIADPTIRQLVGWILQEMTIQATLTTSWRAAVVSTNDRPSCIVADLDDVSDRWAGVAVLRKGWGGNVPLVVLSRIPMIDANAEAVGAVAGLRKPINVGALMDVVRRAVGGISESGEIGDEMGNNHNLEA